MKPILPRTQLAGEEVKLIAAGYGGCGGVLVHIFT